MRKIIINPKAVYLRWLMLLMTLFFATQSYGQNVIYDNPAVSTEYSVIRNYKTDVDISYDLEGGTLCFNYHDLTNMASYSFPIPYWLNIFDFEIIDDTVYFCGSELLSGGACFGWFDINSVFFGTGTVYYWLTPSSHYVPQPIPDHEIVGGFLRMAVLKKSGCMHLYMVGRGRRQSDIFNSESVLAEAVRDAWGVWSLNYTMGYDNQIGYNDVAVTNKYIIVTTSIKCNSARYEAGYQYYLQPTMANPAASIFPVPAPFTSVINYSTDCSVYFKTSFMPNQMTSDHVIEHTSGDGFATVCKADIPSLGSTAHVFKFFIAPLIPSNDHFSIPNPNSEEYFDVAYNQVNRTISVIPWHGYDKILTAITPYNIVHEVYPMERRWFSIDYIPSTSLYTVRGCSATSAANSKIWRYNENGVNCITRIPINTTMLTDTVNHENVIQYIRTPPLEAISLDVKSLSNGLYYICR